MTSILRRLSGSTSAKLLGTTVTLKVTSDMFLCKRNKLTSNHCTVLSKLYVLFVFSLLRISTSKVIFIIKFFAITRNQDVEGEPVPRTPSPGRNHPRGLGGRDERGPGRGVDEDRCGHGKHDKGRGKR